MIWVGLGAIVLMLFLLLSGRISGQKRIDRFANLDGEDMRFLLSRDADDGQSEEE